MRRRSAGQAMVETAVAVAVFATLLAMLPGVLAYHDIQRATLRSARDVVFLTAWNRGRAPETELLRNVQSSLADLPWRHVTDGSKLLDGEPGRVRTSNTAPPGEAARLLEFIAAPLRTEDSYLGPEFALDQAGFRTAEVSVDVPAISGAPEPFSRLQLTLTERSVALTGAWNAAGPGHVAERASGLVPTSLIRKTQAPLAGMAAVLSVIEPAFRELCPGLIEPERVPGSRLQGEPRAGLGAARAGGGGRCP